MIMSWFRALIILIRLGPFITTNANELTMFANQPLLNGHPTLHIAITPNAPLDAVVLYIFIFCSILTKRSSEKYTTDIKCIYYTNRTHFFGCILVYGSLLFLSSAHVMKQEISKGRNYLCFKYDKTDNSYPALIGKVTPHTWNCITGGLCIYSF
jgi:hypothetical protein